MTPHDTHFIERVRASFDKQQAMALIRATLPVIEHGRTEIHLPHWEGVEQQHGFIHGGVVGMIADSAAGYAAMTLVSASASVLTIGQMTPFAPPSSTLPMIPGSFQGTRTSGVTPCGCMPWKQAIIEW